MKTQTRLIGLAVGVFLLGNSSVVADDTAALEKRVAELEEQVAKLEALVAPVAAKVKREQIVEEQQKLAQARMRKDWETYSNDERREIEELYQSANRDLGNPESKEILEQLIETYGKANRTGCALQYLGQVSKGEEREDYLTRAIENFSDCYYGNGVNVGAYARYYLAYHYKDEGDEAKANEIFDELAAKYPDAIDHKGRLLQDIIGR